MLGVVATAWSCGAAGISLRDGRAATAAGKPVVGGDLHAVAISGKRLFVSGHEGLYASSDGGATFSSAQVDLPVTDVHAMGGSGRTVHLASPQADLAGRLMVKPV